ncbi:peroxidase 7-like [Lolium rigidum]|uniref:peroxidase 7-like n=1 Tax=Lolium rigidum TaxID=89674 RepID=UPI001F5DC4F4|nr:peroxidase 7-like [Lolium rigidum]
MRTPSSSVLSFLALSAFVLACSAMADGGQRPAYENPVEGLDSGYYAKSCPDMEGIVQRIVNEAFDADYTVAAGLIRLFFHDFAVGGCDASILIDAPGSEKYAKSSKTLRGFGLIEAIKTELEEHCPRTVSCADILTAATRDVSREVGVGYWPLKFGRKDGRQSSAAAADKYVPMGRESVTDLIALFESNGLNVRDLVVLSGAHSIGKASCTAVKPRLCNSKPDTLDRKYGDFLRRKCRHSGYFAEYERVELDGETPTVFDNVYFKNLERKMGLLETDQKMLEDSRTKSFVQEMVREPEEFKHEFAMAMRRLGEVQVLTGNEGEVRHKCSAVNKH